MTDRARDVIDALQWLINYYPKWHSEADPCAVMHSAIGVIESLTAELEQVKQELDGLTFMLTAAESAAETYKRERDAAIADIPRACGYCKHHVESTHQYTNSLPCAHVSGVNTRWQWRGTKEG